MNNVYFLIFGSLACLSFNRATIILWQRNKFSKQTDITGFQVEPGEKIRIQVDKLYAFDCRISPEKYHKILETIRQFDPSLRVKIGDNWSVCKNTLEIPTISLLDLDSLGKLPRKIKDRIDVESNITPLYHELAHVKYQDALSICFYNFISCTTISIIAFRFRNVTTLFSQLVTLPFAIAQVPLKHAIHRKQEKRADLYAVEVAGSAKPLIEWFEHHRQSENSAFVKLPWYKKLAYFIENSWFFRTHPSYETRIKYLL